MRLIAWLRRLGRWWLDGMTRAAEMEMDLLYRSRHPETDDDEDPANGSPAT